ncbi:MAG: sulfite exporter TauE/SafE family protein [Candidatus Marsarchaeota archaeon]|nr:sulfite exporter TauE/SafE family protein [Candidatus Marsarchaeota archaeon]
MIQPLLLGVLLIIGVIAGFIGSLTGLGGAAVIMPVLSIGLGFPVEYAVGAALVSTIATSSGAASAYVKDKITNIRIGMSLEIGTTLGAIIGALLAAVVYSHNLSFLIFILFGVFLLISIYPTLRRIKGESKSKRIIVDKSTKIFQLKGSYYDVAAKRRFSYAGTRWWLGESIMFVAGILSGLLGIGSGVLKVLAMDSGMRLPVKVSTATSNFMIGVTAVTGSAIYWALGYIQPLLVAPIIIGVLIGAYLGSFIMEEESSYKIGIIFTVFILIIAIETMLRGFGIA